MDVAQSPVNMDVSQYPVRQRFRSSFDFSTDICERQQPVCLFCGDTKGDFHKAETLPESEIWQLLLETQSYLQVYYLVMLLL